MTQELTQSDSRGEGNIKLHRARTFFITTFNEEEFDSLNSLISDSKMHALGEEHCPTTNKLHRHLWVRFKNQRYWKAIKKVLPTSDIEESHATPEAALKYVSKEKLLSHYIGETKPLKLIKELRPWQQDIENLILSEPDDRTIHWYWEPMGNFGKTSLIKYLLVKYNFITFSRATKSADILTVADIKKTCYLFDFARSQEGFCPWIALEQLKDGLISDSKLKKESRNLVMDSPHIIVFANWPPDTSALSADRWHIVRLGEEGEEQELF